MLSTWMMNCCRGRVEAADHSPIGISVTGSMSIFDIELVVECDDHRHRCRRQTRVYTGFKSGHAVTDVVRNEWSQARVGQPRDVFVVAILHASIVEREWTSRLERKDARKKLERQAKPELVSSSHTEFRRL